MKPAQRKVPRKTHKVDVPLPLERSRWLRPSGLLTGLAALGLTALFAFVSVELDRSDPSTWAAAEPAGGYSWAVSQYQVGFLRFWLELNAAAMRETIYPEDLRLRGKQLGEMAQRLKPALEGSAPYAQAPVFMEARSKFEDFHGRLTVLLSRSNFGKSDAMLMLIELESMEATLNEMVNKVTSDDQARRDSTVTGLQARRSLLWRLMAGTWLLVVTWLVTVAVAARKQSLADKARRLALDAERKAVLDKESAVHEKSRFLTSISHELRSALQSIRSALDLIQQEPGHQNRVLIGRIQRATDALVTQLQDLLTVARGEAGALEMHPAPFEAGELVQDVAMDHRKMALEKGLRFSVSVPSSPLHLVADYTRIAQVLNNLVSNAVKYTASGAVRIVVHEYDTTKQSLVISVCDTGPGIPRNLIGRIWEQYQRLGGVDRTTESAGIGLAVVKTLTTILGATIEVNTESGKGSEFVVRIPAMPLSQEGIAPEDHITTKVLIVDDRKEILEGLADVARSIAGVSVDTASSAALGANWMATKRFDLVLIDLDMPNKNGAALASATRSGAGPNSRSHLVAISAADGREVGSAWPFNEFVQKPIDRRALQRLVEGGRSGPQQIAA